MKIKRLVCLVAAAAMAFSLAACGGSGSGGNSDSGNGGAADNGSAAAGEATMDFEGQTLTVANWSDYATDQEYGYAAFEEMYNCHVEFYDITSYPELLQTMLNGGQADIDVVNINPMYIQQYYGEGVITPIDTSRITCYDELREDITGIDDVLTEDGEVLGVPWIWGTTSMFYNADAVDGSQIDSWADLWDPQYAGKVAFFDDYTNCIMIAALVNGDDPYDPDLDAVRDKLMELKPNIRTIWSTYDDFMSAITSGQVVIGNAWPSNITELRNQGMNIEYIYPEEGTIGWADYWCLVDGSAESDLAMAWIDFCTNHDFQYAMATEEQPHTPANEAVMATLDEETLANLWLTNPPETMYMSLYMDNDTLQRWIDLWTEVQAS